MKETLKEAGYTHVLTLGNGQHLLMDMRGDYGVFFANKNHASWGLKYKNTHLEFAHSLSYEEAQRLIFKL